MFDRVLADLGRFSGRLVLVIDDLHELAPSVTRISRASWPSCPRRSMPCWAPVAIFDSACINCGLRESWQRYERRTWRFSAAEYRELLAASGVVLSDQALATLHERTEGWAAGLPCRISWLNIQILSDRRRVLRKQPYGLAITWLASAERQPAQVQRLLLNTSLLERCERPVS